MTTSARRSKEVFTSVAGIQAAHAELLKRHRAVGDAPDILADIEDFMQKAIAAGALLDADSDRWAVQSLLDYWATTLHRATEVLPDATLAEFDPALAPTLDDSLCPYLGLDAFKADQKDRYFGRQQLVEHLLERLAKGRLLALIGPSGSGKSSLILAGVLPALQGGGLPGSEHWKYLPPIVPGADPLESLARMLLPSNAEASRVDAVAAEFRNDPNHLATVLGRQTDPTVVIVDQFEEVLTLCRDDTDRQAFVANLLAVTRIDGPRHTVILTMRDDFMGQVSRLPALAGQFERVLTVVVPPTAAELRDAIEKPAAQIGLKFEEGLVDQLLKDVVNEPAGLPLLQFTLLKLWEARDHNRITRRAYERLGGGRECLARSADEVWIALGLPENQEAGKRILLELVRPEGRDFTSKRVRRERLYKIGIPANRISLALDRLVTARLLRVTPGETDADDRIEVAHEALVRNWPKLSAWLEEERERMRHRIALTAKAEEWENRSRDRNLLLRGEVLQEAQRYEELGEVETAYVQASLAERERYLRNERLRRGVMVALIAIIVIGSIVASAVFYFKNQELDKLANNERAQRLRADSALGLANVAMGEAQKGFASAMASRDTAREASQRAVDASRASLAMATESQVARTADKSSDLSVLLALYATHINRSESSERALEAASRAWALPAVMRLPDSADILSIAVSPDSTWVAAAADSTIQFWNLRTRARGRTLIGHTDIIRDLVFDQGGARLISAGDDSTIRVWDVATGRELETRRPRQGNVISLALSPNGKWLASAGTDGRALIWDKNGRQIAQLKQNDNAVWDLAFKPDNAQLVTASSVGEVWMWNTQNWSVVDTLGSSATRHRKGILDIAFSPDGRYIATGSLDSTARIWNSRDGGRLKLLPKGDQVWDVTFSPDGNRLATGNRRGQLQIWDVSTALELRRLPGHNSAVYAMSYVDRSHLLSADGEGTIILWDLSGDLEEGSIRPFIDTLSKNPGPLYALGMSQDGKRVAAGSNDGRIWLGPVDFSGTEATVFGPENRKTIRGVALNPAATIAAFVDPDSLTLWDVRARRALWRWGYPQDTTAAGVPDTAGQHSADFWGVAISPDGKYIATASLDSTLRVFDESGRLLYYIKNGERFRDRDVSIVDSTRDYGQVVTVAFHPKRPHVLVSAGQDNIIHVWDAETGALKQEMTGHTRTILRVAFDSSGNNLVSSGFDGTARVWDFSRPRATTRLVLSGHRDWVWGATFSRDGQFIATSAADSTVRIWDMTSGEEIRVINLSGTTSQTIEFGPNNRLLVASLDGSLRRFAIAASDPDEMIAAARSRVERNFTAQECLQRFHTSCPVTVESQLVTARREALKGNRSAAYAAFSRARSQDPHLGFTADEYLHPLLLTAAMEQGTRAAAQGDLATARARFREAAALDPSLKLNADREASRIADARALMQIRLANRVETGNPAAIGPPAWNARRANATIAADSGRQGLFAEAAAGLAQLGRVSDAIDLMDFAFRVDSSHVRNTDLNGVCWYGAIRKRAAQVLRYCDRAVAMDTTVTGIRDSRGVARALTGNIAGAIADFQAYVGDPRNQSASRERRRAWVAALKRGTPVTTIFSDRVLVELQNE